MDHITPNGIAQYSYSISEHRGVVLFCFVFCSCFFRACDVVLCLIWLGIVSNGEANSSKAGSWQGSLHHVNSTDAKAKEDSSVSEDLSNNEENTDDFFNSRCVLVRQKFPQGSSNGVCIVK